MLKLKTLKKKAFKNKAVKDAYDFLKLEPEIYSKKDIKKSINKKFT